MRLNIIEAVLLIKYFLIESAALYSTLISMHQPVIARRLKELIDVKAHHNRTFNQFCIDLGLTSAKTFYVDPKRSLAMIFGKLYQRKLFDYRMMQKISSFGDPSKKHLDSIYQYESEAIKVLQSGIDHISFYNENESKYVVAQWLTDYEIEVNKLCA